MKKRALAIILAISLLLCIAPQVAPAASAVENFDTFRDPLRYGWHALEEMDNSENLLFAYAQIIPGIANAEDSISVRDDTHFVTVSELQTVLDAVRSDYPEFFWLGLSYSYSSLYGQVYDLLPNYTMDMDQILTAKAALEQNTQLLLTGLEDKTDYEISLLIHDRLAAFMRYQYSDNDQTIYGALVQREAVCAGYASAYQYLMQQAGIPAWKVTGSSINPATGSPEGHAWTLVCLDGSWYHTDVTWDDQGKIYHANLNVTTQRILEDHALNPFFANSLPDCSSTDHNYFIRNNTYMESFDATQVATALQANHLQASIYVTGSVSAFLQDFGNNIGTIIKQLGLQGSISYGYGSLGREVQLYIKDKNYAPFPVGITLSALPVNTVWKDTADVTGGMLEVHYDNGDVTSVAITADMISGFDPTVSGKQVVTVTLNDLTEYFTVQSISKPPVTTVPGDFTGDNLVNNEDVVLLLWHTLFPTEYPVEIPADLTGDGMVNNDDVVLLLWHTLFPQEYPL